MSHHGEVTDVQKGKTKYKATWAEENGNDIPLAITPTEWKAITARGQKNISLLPDLEGEPLREAAISMGYLDTRAIGLKADWNPGVGADKWTDNHAILQKHIDDAPEYSMIRLYIPAGAYHFKDEIKVPANKGIDIQGDRQMPYSYMNTVATKFIFGDWRQPKNGFNIPGKALPGTISDLWLVGNTEPTDQVSGIYHENIMQIIRVMSQDFTYGFYTQAGVEDGNNSSLSYYQSCRASNNKKDGFFAGGADANVISYINCVSIQNWEWGFHDATMYGVEYFGCQSATNGRKGSEEIEATWGGGWRIDQVMAWTNIVACYSEKDQGPNYINPTNFNAKVSGGCHDNDWSGSMPHEAHTDPGGDIEQGAKHTRLITNYLKAPQLDMGEISLKQTQGYGEAQRAGFYSHHGAFVEMVSPGVPHMSLGSAPSHQPQAKRAMLERSVSLPAATWRGTRADVLGKPDMPGFPFMVGDRLENYPYNPEEPEYYRCTRAGRNGANTEPIPIATMQSWHGDQSLQFATLANLEHYKRLMVGDALKFQNGATGQVWSIDTMYRVEVRHVPGIRVRQGDRVGWFGKLVEYLQPIGYTDNSVILTYEPSTRKFKEGEELIVDGLPTTVKSVVFDRGVQKVELNLPPGGDPNWFRNGADISMVVDGKESIRTPWEFRNPRTKEATAVIGFPMADLQPGAIVHMNGKETQVKNVFSEGISIKPIEGNVWANQKGSFTIQTPQFKAYGNE